MSKPAKAPIQESVPPPTGALRIALTLPGGVSFGTVEAGAVCALLLAVQQLNTGQRDAPCIDIIAGSSAGALSGILAAHTLLWGEDPLPVFRRAWVVEPSLKGLLGRGHAAPLTLDRARTVAKDLLAERNPADVARRQGSDVTLLATLGCLRGLGYRIERPARVDQALAKVGGSEVRATSYLDWARHTLLPIARDTKRDEEQQREWKDAVSAALASASHPAVFPPEPLERKRDAYEEGQKLELSLEPRLDKGVLDPKKDVRLWYTDGGLVDNQPLGRCLDVVGDLDRKREDGPPADKPQQVDENRLVMLIRSGVDRLPPKNDPAWAGATRPRWTETLTRALGLLAAHSVGEDLRELEKVNSRITRTAELADQLKEHLSPDAEAALHAFLKRIDAEQEALPRHREGHKYDRPDAPLLELVQAALFAASGLRSKRRVAIAIVEPDRKTSLAAGRGLLQFGGFLDRRRREYDFAAGYWSMIAWLESPAAKGLHASDDDLKVVMNRVRRPQPSRARAWHPRRLRTRLLLARVAWRVARIVVSDAIAIRRRKKVD